MMQTNVKEKAADLSLSSFDNVGTVGAKLTCANCKAAHFCSIACQKQELPSSHQIFSQKVPRTPEKKRPRMAASRTDKGNNSSTGAGGNFGACFNGQPRGKSKCCDVFDQRHQIPMMAAMVGIPVQQLRPEVCTIVDTAVYRLFGGEGKTGTCEEHFIRLRARLKNDETWWSGNDSDSCLEQIGKGAYGEVYRGTQRNGRGEVAIKRLPAEENSVKELVMQAIVFAAYDASAVAEWAPVHHPFPQLFQVTGTKEGPKEYTIQASMFLFQPAQFNVSTCFEMTVQLAAVLDHTNRATGLKLMHRDLHPNNVTRREKSRNVELTLWLANGKWALKRPAGDPRPRSHTFHCGMETNLIDFGLARVELVATGEVLETKNTLYTSHAFNSQHDLRLFLVSAYSQWCVDPATLRPRKPHELNAFQRLVVDLIDLGRTQSPRFAMCTSLTVVRHVAAHLRATRSTSSATFADWFNAIETPFLDVSVDRWARHYVPLLRAHRHLWRTLWTEDKMPSLWHFLYNYGVTIDDTPCFEPAAVLNTVAASWLHCNGLGTV